MTPNTFPNPLRSTPKSVAASTAFCLAAMLLYAGTVFHPPVWDDHVFVFGQPLLMDCRNLPRVVSPRNFTGVLVAKNAARPVWLASVLLDTCMGDGAVPVYRIDSIYWHAMGALLVLALAGVLSGSLEAAAAAGILFAAHPVHAEAVNLITNRSDLLCLAFMLGSLILYRQARPALALVCAALALLSKEMAVVLPPLFLLADAAFPRTRASARPHRLAFAAASVAVVLAYMVFHAPRSGYRLEGTPDPVTELAGAAPLPFSRPLTEAPTPPFGLPEQVERPAWRRVYSDRSVQILTMSRVFGSYLRLLSWPSALQGDYSPRIVDSWLDPGVLASWAAWLALLIAAWLARRKIPLFSFGIGWTIVALVPVSGAVHILNLQAERYLYAASAGWCMAAGGLLAALARGGGRRRAAAVLLLAALAAAESARLWRRNQDFRSDRAFLGETIAADPGVERAHLSLALRCETEGDAPCAEAEFRETLRLSPDETAPRLYYSDFLRRRGRFAEESEQLESARKLAPEDPAILLPCGISEWRAGRRDEAAASLRAALKAAPEHWVASELLGTLLLETGRDREAVPYLLKASDKSVTALYHLCVALRRSGREAEAEPYLALLRRSSPKLAEAALARQR